MSGQLRADYSGKVRGRPMLDLSEKLEKLRITPFDQRSTLRAASLACVVARATLQRSAPSAGALEALHHEGDDAGGSGAATLEYGIWPFIVQEPAVRISSRRPAGTMITKEDHVNKATYRKTLIQHLLPAVCERWPSVCNGKLLRVQQDNAPAHICPVDTHFVAAAAELGLTRFKLARGSGRTIEDLVEAVKAAYWELPPSTINAAFLSLQGSMYLCILDGGGNALKPSHIGKAKL
ncbi:hypothetical protein PC114_g3720 [Phytophthora cactorum]|nr:hypothetical protein PC114_g3720 [Phytophthora cactorum]KAG3032815.1 hypothetical protein PC120_g2283 [Phytophthora cactorum]